MKNIKPFGYDREKTGQADGTNTKEMPNTCHKTDTLHRLVNNISITVLYFESYTKIRTQFS